MCAVSSKTRSEVKSRKAPIAASEANGEVDEVNKRIYALAEWNPKKVFQYLKNHGIQLAPEYRYAKRSIGDLRPENVEVLKEHFPDDYETVKRIFPYIEAKEKQNEFKKQRHTASGVE